MGPIQAALETGRRNPLLAVVKHDRIGSAVRCPSLGTSHVLGIPSLFWCDAQGTDALGFSIQVDATRMFVVEG
jgi:hypothetical protein